MDLTVPVLDPNAVVAPVVDTTIPVVDPTAVVDPNAVVAPVVDPTVAPVVDTTTPVIPTMMYDATTANITVAEVAPPPPEYLLMKWTVNEYKLPIRVGDLVPLEPSQIADETACGSWYADNESTCLALLNKVNGTYTTVNCLLASKPDTEMTSSAALDSVYYIIANELWAVIR